ncbi:protein S100-A12-like [Sarcoramphus papa]
MKTDLELALECVVNIYHQYAIKYPIDDYLNKGEFSDLLKETAKPFLYNTMPPNMSIDDYISKLFTRADHNHDGRLKFTEFLTTLNLVAIDAHNRSHQHPDAGHGHGHSHDHGHGHDHGPRE